MKKTNSQQLWIDAGYNQFAVAGPEGIKVEQIARIINLNKSGYYHYFGDLDTFFGMLINYHKRILDLFAEEILAIKHFDPEFVTLLLNYRTTVMMQKQLSWNRHNPFLVPLLNAQSYITLNNKIDQAIAPLWAEFIGIPNNPEVAMKYFELVRDSFSIRIAAKELNQDSFLRNLLNESRELIKELLNLNRISPTHMHQLDTYQLSFNSERVSKSQFTQ